MYQTKVYVILEIKCKRKLNFGSSRTQILISNLKFFLTMILKMRIFQHLSPRYLQQYLIQNSTISAGNMTIIKQLVQLPM